MIAVYSNNCDMDLLIRGCNFNVPFVVHHDLDTFEQDASKIKFAFVLSVNGYQQPESQEQWHEWMWNGNRFSKEIQIAKKFSTKVFAFDNEFHAYHWSIIHAHQDENVYWFLPVTMNHSMPRLFTWFCQFHDMKMKYHNQPLSSQLSRLRPFAQKPFVFDALLGDIRSHRNFVYNRIRGDHLIEPKILLNYHGLQRGRTREITDKLRLEPEIQKESVHATWNEVDYMGYRLAISRIVPISIYNQCAYSIVAETHNSNGMSFYTEKILKPILARRLFVVFSGVHFLRNLKTLGFKTFDAVIDESYDGIQDPITRWAAAFEQLRRLCQLDQAQVYAEIRHTVAHNFDVLMDTSWNSEMSTVKNLCISAMPDHINTHGLPVTS